MITFDRSFAPYHNERKLQNYQKHKQDITAEDGVRLSVPVFKAART
jgi:hypothetical protein